MAIYLGLMVAIVATGCFFKVNSTKLRQRNFVIITFLVLAAVASLRSYNVGIDTPQFFNNYPRVNLIEWENHNDIRYEFGFFALYKILNLLTDDPQIIIVVSSCFFCLSVGRFIYKNSNDVIFSSFLFIALNIFAMYMNVMRQAIAISIVLFGIELLKKPKLLNIVFYILLVFLAMQFHNSAGIMILPIFFVKFKYTNISYISTLIIAAVFFIFTPILWNIMLAVFPSYAGYTDSQFADSNYFAAAINTAVCFVMLSFGFLFSNKNKRLADGEDLKLRVYGNNGKNVLSYDFNAYLLSAALIFLATAMRMTLLARFSTYFTIYYIVWLPNIASSMINKKDKAFITFLALIFTLAFFVIIAIMRPEWHGVVPYQFFWEV